ncbi:MAG: T6SS effector BTH_I2691 family protein [Xenophilus sp.]
MRTRRTGTAHAENRHQRWHGGRTAAYGAHGAGHCAGAGFKLDADTVKKHVAPWVPFQFNSRAMGADSFKAAVTQARPQGGAAIVALHEPVGLVMEIAALMETRKLNFMAVESDAKPRFAASTIASMESAIKAQAEQREVIASEELAQRAEEGPGAFNPNAALAGIGGDYEEAARWRQSVTPAHLRRVADQKWRQYTHKANGQPRFDESASKSWLDGYDRKFQNFDTGYIAPLAKAHAAWMKHSCLIEQMTCNHDEADQEDGVAYTDTVAKLLRYTEDKQPSYDLYLSWLKSGEFAAENLVMRALAFNQKELIAKIQEADEAPVDGRAFPSDVVAGAIAAYIEKMPASANDRLVALLAGISGPALKYWDDFNAGKAGSSAAAAPAGVSGKQFVRLPINGNTGQFIQAYMRQLYLLDPNLKINPNQLQKAISAQMRLLKIQGVPTQAKGKLGWYVLLDREVVAGATSKGLAGQALADEVAKAIRTPEDLRKIDLARATRVRNVAAAGGTMLAGLLMVWNYTKLLEDVEKGMSHEKTEAIAKLWAGRVAIGGFVAEQVGNGLEKLGETRLKNMMGRAGAFVPRALQIVGRFAGFGVGLMLGMWDISKGGAEFRKGDFGLATAYFVSGFAGIAVATTMLFVAMGWVALGPLGWIVLAIGVLIWLAATLFIETNKDNKLQEWLSRCHFGTGVEKYPDTATHVEQYKLALTE